MHGGGGGGSGSKKKATINVIPLIDVIMFLLATFVLFTLSMSKNNGASGIVLNEAKSGTDVDPNRAVTLSLETDGKMSWNKDPITWDNFIIKLVEYSGQDSPTILINFDQNANWGQAMSVFNEIRKAPKKVTVYISHKLPSGGGRSS